MAETATSHRRLEGKTVLITGGAQGIGLATALLAKDEGATVIIGDLQAEKGQAAAEAAGVAFVPLDVADEQSVKAAVDRVIADHGRIDVLVNNAGVVRLNPAEDTTRDDWDATMAVDLTGVFTVTQEVGKHMRAAGSGSIVNLSSVSAFVAMHPERLFAYSAAKAGVAQLARTIAIEWAPYGIRANSVSPGRVLTDMVRDNVGQDVIDEMKRQSPQARMIDPSEIAEVIVFLGSDASSAVNGHNLVADTGFLAK